MTHEKDIEQNDEIGDISLKPGANADSEKEIKLYIREDVLQLYDVYSYRHAAAIIKNSFPNELGEIENALMNLNITTADMAQPGGNESVIPKKLSLILRPANWYETRIQGDLIVRIFEHTEEVLKTGKVKKHSLPEQVPLLLENYIDGHKIDYVKGRVALDMEWNSKDQTFDRDLYALRTFHECGIISLGVLITRSEKLNEIFHQLPLLDKNGKVDYKKDGKPKLCIQKYGASTTWMGKLLYRLNAGRHGGCPVLVFGIRPDIIKDWKGNKG